ncbi:acetoin dehydrogenase E1 component alpha-subunit [Tetragenococcus muriaticus PMC-11-5]|nr:acetoin dehydrogenase E1 component alpha-subunit [Tetragenococcus muriaticus PMC-11-5]
MENINKQSEEDVQAAIDFAENSSIPEPESLYEDVFAE